MKLAADANVLLSSVLGGRARLILTHPSIEQVLTTEHTFAEVEEYAVVLGEKKLLRHELLLLTVAALHVTVVPRNEYSKSIPEAVRRIGRRDPDDTELLALALAAGVPVWSNDRDFEATGIELWTTGALLRQLRIIR